MKAKELLRIRLRRIQSRLQTRIQLYRAAINDPRTPRAARWLMAAAIGYVLLPFDLVPDFIPVIGHVDDAIIVPLLILFALWLIPGEVLEEYDLAGEPAGHETGSR